jgi:hypothetical protein
MGLTGKPLSIPAQKNVLLLCLPMAEAMGSYAAQRIKCCLYLSPVTCSNLQPVTIKGHHTIRNRK